MQCIATLSWPFCEHDLGEYRHKYKLKFCLNLRIHILEKNCKKKKDVPPSVYTSRLPVVRLCKELTNFVRRYGEGDASRYFQCVDPNHFSILGYQTSQCVTHETAKTSA